VVGEVRPGRIGVWTAHPRAGEAKIAAIGVRLRRWISYHGAALNVSPELDHFRGIVPCGLAGFPVTSLRDLGLSITMREVDDVLRATFPEVMPAAAAAPAEPSGRPAEDAGLSDRGREEGD
jgi:lipoyl(octanoyl) transferase